MLRLFGPPNIAKLVRRRNVGGLVAALRHDDLKIRSDAARALGGMGDPRAAHGLLIATGDESDEVSSAAHAALLALGPAAVDPLITALQSFVFGCVAALYLAQLGDQRAMGPLIAAMGTEVPPSEVGWALAQIDRERAIELLLPFLSDPSRARRWNAVEALGGTCDPHAVPPLLAILADQHADSSLRMSAARALGRIGDLRAVDCLLATLKDTWLAEAAAEALGKLKDNRALEPLLDLLQKSSVSDEQAAAASALGELGDPRAIEPLMGALKRGGWRVRIAAAEALGKLGGSRQAVSQLIACLRDRSSEVRVAAAGALAKLDRRTSRAIKALISALEDSDWGVQKAAVQALGELKDRRAEPDLHRMLEWALECADDDMAAAAARALSRLK